MERPIDFFRGRNMLCGPCGHRWSVALEWLDRWEQSREACPGCGANCELETAPRVTVDPEDPALTVADVAQLAWYHTSTHPDWPAPHFDPAKGLSEAIRRRMGGDLAVARWAERQEAQALHVGTYEAAIHNMLRRIGDQNDGGRQFYLCRVRLIPTVTVRDDWVIDPSDFLGNVVLHQVCPPGTDIARYLNYHEDPGGLSLALGRAAIASTQQIVIPPSSDDLGWIAAAVADLERATVPSAPTVRTHPIGRHRAVSPRSDKAGELATTLTQRLPVNMRSQFQAAAHLDHDQGDEEWAHYVKGLVEVILAPEQVLAELNLRPSTLLWQTR